MSEEYGNSCPINWIFLRPFKANLDIIYITHSHSISSHDCFRLKRTKKNGFTKKKALQLNNFKGILVNEDINLKNQFVFDYRWQTK